MSKARPLRKIGPLEAIEVPGIPGGYCVVMLHGYGADATDLVSLSQLLSAPPGTTWLFPNGPMKISGGGIFGRAWFPIDVAKLEEEMAQGIHMDMAKHTPPGLKAAREQVTQMLSEMKIPPAKTVFAGFSQGAMVATDLALKAAENPLGLVILSGNLINEDVWKQRATARAGLHFFQSHGLSDPILGFEFAQRLEKLLVGAGLKGQLLEFPGGHEIPQDVIYGLNAYFKQIMKPHKERN
jgi:phospholipase/carboxylesterase